MTPRLAARLCGLFLILLLTSPEFSPSRLQAELTVTGQKDFEYRSYSSSGSFNQFLRDHPLFLDGQGFDQSLSLEVTGTINESIRLDLAFDDTFEDRENQKLLLSIDGRIWDVNAGRLSLAVEDTRYLLFNKQALAVAATGTLGRHRLTLLAGRPEGQSQRNFFRGNGTQQEFVLQDGSGRRNIPVVQGSEIVHLDNRRLARGQDYDFDYEEGSLLLRHHLLPIEETSTLTIEFEALGSSEGHPGTILGLRDRYTLHAPEGEPVKDLSAQGGTSRTDEEYIAFSHLMNRDIGTASAAAAGPDPPVDGRLTVTGLDGRVVLRDDLILSGEAAMSRLQGPAFGPSGQRRDWAYDLSLARRVGRLTFDLAHQHVGPDFRAIGREEFVRLGEASDLIRDARITRLDLDYDLSGRLAMRVRGQRSRTNLDRDPALPTVDFDEAVLGTTYEAGRDVTLDLGRRIESRETRAPQSGGTSGFADRDVSNLVLTIPLRSFTTQATLEHLDNEGDLPGLDTRDVISRALHFSRSRSERLGWTLSVSDQRRPGLTHSLSGKVQVNLSPNRKLNLDLSLLSRRDQVRASILAPEEETTTHTGEGQLRYRPDRRLRVDLKASAEQRSRIIRRRDPRDTLPVRESDRLPNTLVSDRPVLRRIGSGTVNWKPTKRWNHRAQVRLNFENDAESGETFGSSRNLSYRLRFAPTSRLRTTLNLGRNHQSSTLNPLDRLQETRSLEVLHSFPKGLTARITRREEDTVDQRGPSDEEHRIENEISAERIVNRFLTGELTLRQTDRKGRLNDEAWTTLLGIRYSPKSVDLRTELSLEHSSIDGTSTAGERFKSAKDAVNLRADYRLSNDTLVEGSVQWADAGPDASGEPGYQSVSGEVRVSVGF